MDTLPTLPGEDIATFIYLTLLGTVIGGWLIASNRGRLGKLAQYFAIWCFIFIGAIVTVGLWTDIRQTVTPRQSVMMDGARIELPRSVDGHYYVTLDVNGAPIRFVVDTGASEMVLSHDDAERVGIDFDRLVFSGRAFTANGMVETAPVVLDSVSVGNVKDSAVRAVVNGTDMRDSLLGMSYLQRFSRLEISDGMMVLER